MSSETIYALDIETGPYTGNAKVDKGVALMPWHPDFYVKEIGIRGAKCNKVLSSKSDNFVNDVLAEIDFLADNFAVCHNAVFDISCLMRIMKDNNCSFAKLKKIHWRDTSLTTKWLYNSQKYEHFRYSLANSCELVMPDHPKLEEFLNVKEVLLSDDAYWHERLLLDCEMTFDLFWKTMSEMPREMIPGLVNEQKCLFPLAEAQMQGIMLDEDTVLELSVSYKASLARSLRELSVSESVLRSPAQLGNLIYKQWLLPVPEYTPTGSPSTKSSVLKKLALTEGDERLTKLLEAKKLATVISKYANGMSVLGDTMIPSARLYNGYTGRMGYSSKILKKYRISIALHQLPRKDKLVKRAMTAPNGYKFLYADFNAQELRLMAYKSQDPKMLAAFAEGIDLHSTMAESTSGIPYSQIEKEKNTVQVITDVRNNGKLTNLSAMYRIGAKSLQAKFFEQYDKIITIRESQHYLNSYKKTFRGIPKYWASSILRAKSNNGYAETLSGRRYKIDSWDWKGESSAINFPIQGSGADLSEYAIQYMSEVFPVLIFQVQVHDSLTWLYPEDTDPYIYADYLNNINWSEAFGKTINVDFPLDCAVGYNLADLEEL